MERPSPPIGLDELVALAIGVTAAFAVLVAIAVVNNDPRIWDTAAFCGSYADFREPPVPEVCLSFPYYLRLSLFHPPYVIPALLVGLLAGIVYYRRERLSETWN